jgi:SAM-dependent methyltransferase
VIPFGAHNWSVRLMNKRAVARHAHVCHGDLLDIGCGERPYEWMLAPYITRYVGMEHPATMHRQNRVDVWGDAQALPFADESFDTIVGFHMLEHTEDPRRVLAETARVLRSGGTLLLTTPFVWGIHEAPRDFFRFTSFGLDHLVKSAGFTPGAIEPFCGTWATLGLRLSYLLARSAPRGLGTALAPLVALLQLIALALDRWSSDDADPAGYVVVARRP